VIEHLSRSLDFSTISPDPSLMDGFAMRQRLAELGAGDYDYIVIDGPHVLGRADVNLLQESASAVLFTMLARESQAGKLRKAIEQIGQRRVIGVVLMGVPA
jgi:Mrp family chromosome partitioning ATPase